jgi:hypothetical protein
VGGNQDEERGRRGDREEKKGRERRESRRNIKSQAGSQTGVRDPDNQSGGGTRRFGENVVERRWRGKWNNHEELTYIIYYGMGG